jgi:hypothetical protein
MKNLFKSLTSTQLVLTDQRITQLVQEVQAQIDETDRALALSTKLLSGNLFS